MGLGGSKLRYEGYGKSMKDALVALDSLLRFHYDHATVRVGKTPGHYFVWRKSSSNLFSKKSRQVPRIYSSELLKIAMLMHPSISLFRS